MKLRNKITNKICDAEARDDGIYVKTNFGDGEEWHKYGLGCLGDNWEYYVEPKEPLIKDEKIRKAVRAWAEANGFSVFRVNNQHFNYVRIHGVKDRYSTNGSSIEFMGTIAGAEKRTYEIAELCGEEEE